jgi:hypothetical protein
MFKLLYKQIKNCPILLLKLIYFYKIKCFVVIVVVVKNTDYFYHSSAASEEANDEQGGPYR